MVDEEKNQSNEQLSNQWNRTLFESSVENAYRAIRAAALTPSALFSTNDSSSTNENSRFDMAASKPNVIFVLGGPGVGRGLRALRSALHSGKGTPCARIGQVCARGTNVERRTNR